MTYYSFFVCLESLGVRPAFHVRVSAGSFQRASAKKKEYFHARGNASAESRNLLGRREAFLPSSQVQGRAHACCIGMGNTREEKSLIERRFRAGKYLRKYAHMENRPKTCMI